MMLLDEIKNIKSGRKDLKKFGASVGSVLFFIGCFLILFKRDYYGYFIVSGLALNLLGYVLPFVLKPLHFVWMAFSVVMGWFMTRIILCSLFYLVFTPTRLVAILFRKNFLDLKFDSAESSYWIPKKEKSINKSDYEHQF